VTGRHLTCKNPLQGLPCIATINSTVTFKYYYITFRFFYINVEWSQNVYLHLSAIFKDEYTVKQASLALTSSAISTAQLSQASVSFDALVVTEAVALVVVVVEVVVVMKTLRRPTFTWPVRANCFIS